MLKGVIINMDGMLEIFNELELLIKDFKQNQILIALVTSLPKDKAEKELRKIEMQRYIDYCISEQTVSNPRPASDVFMTAIYEMGCSWNECLVLECTKEGIKAAKQAGIPCIGFYCLDSVSLDLPGADMVIEGFEEVDSLFCTEVYQGIVGEPRLIAETKRLLIREITVNDLGELYELYHGPGITRFLEPLYDDRKEEEEFTRAYIKNMYGFYGYGMWVVVDKNTNSVIGRAGLNNRDINGKPELELGFMIGVPYQKKGHAYETCRAILDFTVKRLEQTSVSCLIEPDNIPSIALVKKLGFQKIDTIIMDEKKYYYFRWNEV